MNATLLYCLQTILSAGLFIMIYRLFVRNTNSYNWNRIYLLSTMILSLFLPIIDISNWFTVEKHVVLYALLINFNQALAITPTHQAQNIFNLSDVLLTGYWIVAGGLLIRFGWGITRIINMMINNDYKKSDNLRLYPIQRNTTFSFFNYIFIQPEHWDKPVTEYIIRHEQAHVNHLHSIDKILTELILVFGWFNPFYYIYRRDLHLLHECQADQAVINSGCDKTTYHQLLLNEAVGSFTYVIVNQFSYSLIKRRFRMITNNDQSRLTKYRIFIAIPTAFALLLLFSFSSLKKNNLPQHSGLLIPVDLSASLDLPLNKQQHDATIPASGEKKAVTNVIKSTRPEENEVPLTVVEQSPEYQGGGEAMSKFFRAKLHYPTAAQEAGIQGTVFVQFIVSKTGTISDIKILRGIGAECDQEAINVVKEMPDWIPGRQNGAVVPVMYQIPVRFQLQKN